MIWKIFTITLFVVVPLIFIRVFSDSQTSNSFNQPINEDYIYGSSVKKETLEERPKVASPPVQASPTTDAIQEADNLLAAMETEAFRLAQDSETIELARELFFGILNKSPTNTLAAQMMTELCRTRAEKEKTVALILSAFNECPTCTELGLIAADLLIVLDRQSEARQLSNRLKHAVKSESEQRHLASLLAKTGDIDAARTNLEKLSTHRKRIKVRLGLSSPAEIVWEKIDQSELNSLTASGG